MGTLCCLATSLFLLCFSTLLEFGDPAVIVWKNPGVHGRWHDPMNWEVVAEDLASYDKEAECIPPQSAPDSSGAIWTPPQPSCSCQTPGGCKKRSDDDDLSVVAEINPFSLQIIGREEVEKKEKREERGGEFIIRERRVPTIDDDVVLVLPRTTAIKILPQISGIPAMAKSLEIRCCPSISCTTHNYPYPSQELSIATALREHSMIQVPSTGLCQALMFLTGGTLEVKEGLDFGVSSHFYASMDPRDVNKRGKIIGDLRLGINLIGSFDLEGNLEFDPNRGARWLPNVVESPVRPFDINPPITEILPLEFDFSYNISYYCAYKAYQSESLIQWSYPDEIGHVEVTGDVLLPSTTTVYVYSKNDSDPTKHTTITVHGTLDLTLTTVKYYLEHKSGKLGTCAYNSEFPAFTQNATVRLAKFFTASNYVTMQDSSGNTIYIPSAQLSELVCEDAEVKFETDKYVDTDCYRYFIENHYIGSEDYWFNTPPPYAASLIVDNPPFVWDRWGRCTSTDSSGGLSILLTGGSSQGACECPDGWDWSSAEQACTIPNCPGEPDCNNRGECSGTFPNLPVCICPVPYDGDACEFVVCPFGENALECSGHGTCQQDGTCKCDNGYFNDDCSGMQCPNNCTSPDNGICVATTPPKCVCNVGWSLGPDKDCSSPFIRCPGETELCSGNGVCDLSSGNCTCYDGFMSADCSKPICPGSDTTAPHCSHHGICTKNELTNDTYCECEPGWTGADCSVKATCPNDCSNNGWCLTDLTPPRCVCAGGFQGEDCSVPLSAQDCYGNSKCLADHCVAFTSNPFMGPPGGYNCPRCTAGWRGAACDTPYCLDVDIYTWPECNQRGSCVGDSDTDTLPVCQCYEGFDPSTACIDILCLGDNYCGDNGECHPELAPPSCVCDPYYYGDDCLTYDPPICPGFPTECSEHGTCNENGSCICEDNWMGSDCSIAACPGADREEITNCNLNGYCDSNGTSHICICDDGWDALDCSNPYTCRNNCSGHGICRTDKTPPLCECDTAFTLEDDCSVEESFEGGSSKSKLDEEDKYLILFGVFVGLAIVIVLTAGLLILFVIPKIEELKLSRTFSKYKTAGGSSITSLSSINFVDEGDADVELQCVEF